MTAPRPGPRLIPAFPNECTDIVLKHLSFFDLLRVYCVSPNFQRFMSSDDEICARMFRLPKRIRLADDAAREAFVKELWRVADAKFADSYSVYDFEGYIDFNPSFHTNCEMSDWDEELVIRLENTFDLTKLSQISTHLLPELTDLWNSMFITYPPITHVRSHTRHHPGFLGSGMGMHVDTIIERGGFANQMLRNKLNARGRHIRGTLNPGRRELIA
ncbi:hypothetical protein CC86DRAFT_43111 [Ophiobolus disseminans]|uniref:F-box domain-containing protein n=1 Tax=Ophiobolus disseminans TaxID=1469910 RepID=A0A6A6ZXZ4_9PLEO|nr:hypothetical protein CC86DRAFT_43111 [Ophiobolus disseminans]